MIPWTNMDSLMWNYKSSQSYASIYDDDNDARFDLLIKIKKLDDKAILITFNKDNESDVKHILNINDRHNTTILIGNQHKQILAYCYDGKFTKVDSSINKTDENNLKDITAGLALKNQIIKDGSSYETVLKILEDKEYKKLNYTPRGLDIDKNGTIGYYFNYPALNDTELIKKVNEQLKNYKYFAMNYRCNPDYQYCHYILFNEGNKFKDYIVNNPDIIPLGTFSTYHIWFEKPYSQQKYEEITNNRWLSETDKFFHLFINTICNENYIDVNNKIKLYNVLKANPNFVNALMGDDLNTKMLVFLYASSGNTTTLKKYLADSHLSNREKVIAYWKEDLNLDKQDSNHKIAVDFVKTHPEALLYPQIITNINLRTQQKFQDLLDNNVAFYNLSYKNEPVIEQFLNIIRGRLSLENNQLLYVMGKEEITDEILGQPFVYKLNEILDDKNLTENDKVRKIYSLIRLYKKHYEIFDEIYNFIDLDYEIWVKDDQYLLDDYPPLYPIINLDQVINVRYVRIDPEVIKKLKNTNGIETQDIYLILSIENTTSEDILSALSQVVNNPDISIEERPLFLYAILRKKFYTPTETNNSKIFYEKCVWALDNNLIPLAYSRNDELPNNNKLQKVQKCYNEYNNNKMCNGTRLRDVINLASQDTKVEKLGKNSKTFLGKLGYYTLIAIVVVIASPIIIPLLICFMCTGISGPL